MAEVSEIFRAQRRRSEQMNLGVYMCSVLTMAFAIIGILFAVFREKAAVFVSGFNSLPKRERVLYDQAWIARDVRNQCFTWAAMMLIGALLSYFVTSYMAIPAFVLWLFCFFRDVHFDARKAFEKYRYSDQ